MNRPQRINAAANAAIASFTRHSRIGKAHRRIWSEKLVVRVELLASLAIIALCGCASNSKLGGSPGIVVSDQASLPPPTRADLSSQERPYLIGPFDKLTIKVFGIEDLDSEIQADASGRISMPLAGVIEAAGKTPEELARLIEERLRGKYVRDPQVTVNLKETVSQVVTVDGEVEEPGLYPVIGRMTLMKAVATAKGAGEFASLSNVAIFRTVNGQRMVALYNLKSIRRGVYDDPEVFANDVVVVGDNAARRIFKDAIQIVPALTTPLVYILTR